MPERRKKTRQPRQGKFERYIQPSILLTLHLHPSYGYEIIQNIGRFGFVEGQAPPGMIYRHLRQMEEEGLVSSKWETEGAGPARRTYEITPEGLEVLEAWVRYMEEQARRLDGFVEHYRAALRPE